MNSNQPIVNPRFDRFLECNRTAIILEISDDDDDDDDDEYEIMDPKKKTRQPKERE